MFYAHVVLAKKGPYARIWLAAHWDKKLTKAHVFETNIEQSIDGIMQPKAKLALRTSGHLLLGVVRIYSRKAKYLLADCNEAFVKIKMAFRPGMVDLPEEHREAAVNAITLPEVFHDFDTPLPELNDVDIEAQFSINQSRADEITMREDYGTLPMSINDDGFGDMGFDADTPDLMRDGLDHNIEDDLFAESLAGPSDADHTKEPMPGCSRSGLDSLHHHSQINEVDGFGDEFGQPAAGLFEGDIFASILPGGMTSRTIDSDDDDHFDVGAPSPAPSSDNSRPSSPLLPPQSSALDNLLSSPAHPSMSSIPQLTSPTSGGDMLDSNIQNMNLSNDLDSGEAGIGVGGLDEHGDGVLNPDQTTLLNNEEESFALAPVDASALRGVTKAKRKRKLIVDEVKNISGEEMKSQLANTTDIVTTLDLAPPTKRLMYWKEIGGVEKLFALPARHLPARCLFKLFQNKLVSRPIGIEDFSILGPADVLALDQNQSQVQSNQPEEPESPITKRGRKRKQTAAAAAAAINLFDQSIPAAEQTLPDPEPMRDLGMTPMPQTPLMDLNGGDGGDLCDQTLISHTLDGNGTHHNDSLMPPPPTPGGGLNHFGSPSQSMMISGLQTPTLTSTSSIPMTPGNLSHGMTPLHDGGFTPSALDHGGITPHHSIEHMDSIPNLPADQVSSILNGSEMDNYANMGYDGHGSPGRVDMSERIANDWNEDYDFPASVGQTGEEQMIDETIEQFEERVLNKRAAQMFISVRTHLQRNDGMYLSEMTYKNTKKQAAQKFYSLLVLKKFQALEIHQSEPYGDILVSRGPMFENPKL